jgi:hypothetical protein
MTRGRFLALVGERDGSGRGVAANAERELRLPEAGQRDSPTRALSAAIEALGGRTDL